MLLIVDEHKVTRRRRFEARHADDLNAAVANQADFQRLRDLTKRALHGSHCIAEMRDEGRVDLSVLPSGAEASFSFSFAGRG